MPRSRTLLHYALATLGLVALFAVVIAVRDDTALLTALTAAGTVAAAVFAAIAATGSMRAAAESSAAARRSREAMARTAQPRVHPALERQDGGLIGTVTCGQGHAAVDVSVVWVLKGGQAFTKQLARLEAPRPDLPGGGTVTSAVDLRLPDTADVAKELSMVWIEYWDDARVGHWQDTWRVETDPPLAGTLVISDSRLVG